MKNSKEMIEGILANVGGKDNIAEASHCMTRLRLNLKNSGLVNEAALKKVDGVLGVVNKGT